MRGGDDVEILDRVSSDVDDRSHPFVRREDRSRPLGDHAGRRVVVNRDRERRTIGDRELDHAAIAGDRRDDIARATPKEAAVDAERRSVPERCVGRHRARDLANERGRRDRA